MVGVHDQNCAEIPQHRINVARLFGDAPQIRQHADDDALRRRCCQEVLYRGRQFFFTEPFTESTADDGFGVVPRHDTGLIEHVQDLGIAFGRLVADNKMTG